MLSILSSLIQLLTQSALMCHRLVIFDAKLLDSLIDHKFYKSFQNNIMTSRVVVACLTGCSTQIKETCETKEGTINTE